MSGYLILSKILNFSNYFYYLCLYTKLFKLDWVILSILILCVIAIGLYGGIRILEKKAA